MARNFQLAVQTDTRNTRTFNVTSVMLVETLRTRVAEAESCEAGDVLLIHGETKLLDGRNLGFFGINSECTVDMFYREPITITVMTQNGSAKTVKINVNDTLETLQVKTGQKFDTPGRSYEFTYGSGDVIAAGQNLFDLNLAPGACLQATMKLQGGSKI